MLLPLGNISRVIAGVMFPSLATIQGDPQRVSGIFLKTIRAVALLAFPVSIGTFVVAEPLILTLYGPKWEGSVELLRILSLLGINQSVGSLNGIIYQSQNATVLQFKWGLVVNSLCVSAILAGLPYGTRGVAIAYTVTSLAITIPNWMVLGLVIPIKLSEILWVCAGPFLTAALMGSSVFLVDSFLLSDAHVAVRWGLKSHLVQPFFWHLLRVFVSKLSKKQNNSCSRDYGSRRQSDLVRESEEKSLGSFNSAWFCRADRRGSL